MLDAAALALRRAFVEHGGVRVLVADASALREPTDISTLITHVENLIQPEPKGTVWIVMIVRGLHFGRRSAAAIKRVFARVQPWIRASCPVGVTGLQRVLRQVINQIARRECPLFDTVEDAKGWLASQV